MFCTKGVEIKLLRWSPEGIAEIKCPCSVERILLLVIIRSNDRSRLHRLVSTTMMTMICTVVSELITFCRWQFSPYLEQRRIDELGPTENFSFENKCQLHVKIRVAALAVLFRFGFVQFYVLGCVFVVVCCFLLSFTVTNIGKKSSSSSSQV